LYYHKYTIHPRQYGSQKAKDEKAADKAKIRELEAESGKLRAVLRESHLPCTAPLYPSEITFGALQRVLLEEQNENLRLRAANAALLEGNRT